MRVAWKDLLQALNLNVPKFFKNVAAKKSKFGQIKWGLSFRYAVHATALIVWWVSWLASEGSINEDKLLLPFLTNRKIFYNATAALFAVYFLNLGLVEAARSLTSRHSNTRWDWFMAPAGGLRGMRTKDTGSRLLARNTSLFWTVLLLCFLGDGLFSRQLRLVQ